MGRQDFFHHWEPVQRAMGFTQAVRVGDLVFISGTASLDENFTPVHPNDLKAQIGFVYERLRETLAHFSLGFGDVVREVMYCTDMSALVDAVPVRKAVYGDGPFPTATGVEVKQLLLPGLMIEIELIATCPR
jgi:enamine deaminase RidA (YjgF/YER057c/UK114 family)